MTRQTRTRSAERGSVSLALTVLAIALIALIGLVHDGGLKVRAMQRADNAAAEAARAAGQHITGNDLLGDTGLDRPAATAAARSYLKQAGVHGTVAIRGDAITVTTHTTEPTVWLSIIGISSVTGRGEATVRIAEDL
ncbi:pilus assembly protein TadG-related protein [Phytoactinopolyspora limicola]|uniref:pilus assembly protein TadG-related protein n=1 Tax=Phytoactinopolyspora limicola TaxID=2715536 RepID=UPI001407C42A|nr:pilus assembly protein TadG-related protein [Phytoactinopolyspora limicola]